MSKKIIWLCVYGFSMAASFLIVAVLGSEVYYRDRYYREASQIESTSDALEVVKSVNARYEKILIESKAYYGRFCETLVYAPKSKEACDYFFSKKINAKPLLDEADEKILKIFQPVSSEFEKYERYITSHELGYGVGFTHSLGTPYLFILIFACIGLGASTLGSLLSQPGNFSDDQDIERVTALILGPITAMVTALFLVYVFVPTENADLMFSKRLLNVPVSVYISSFVFSVSPTTSISNFAEFSKKQISMLAGKRLDS